jgi:hypothetical protein
MSKNDIEVKKGNSFFSFLTGRSNNVQSAKLDSNKGNSYFFSKQREQTQSLIIHDLNEILNLNVLEIARE